MSAAVFISISLLGCVAIEAVAWWWTHPSRDGAKVTVLSYQPSGGGFQQEPLPGVYERAAPVLRCSSGQVALFRSQEGLAVHGAFFEWNDADTGSVLEAFRHPPEICMGAIGMKLLSKEKPIPYEVDGERLVFDHTVYRDPAGSPGLFGVWPKVHAYRAVWVAGNPVASEGNGFGGRGFQDLRAIRWDCALNRRRPGQARVVQGTVRGALNEQAAWDVFQEAVLRNLHITDL